MGGFIRTSAALLAATLLAGWAAGGAAAAPGTGATGTDEGAASSASAQPQDGAQSTSPEATAEPAAKQKRGWGPWIASPIFSSNPKLGTSLGAVAGLLYYFDETSRPSMFGVSGQYSSTESYTVALKAKTSFAGDRHRATLSIGAGQVLNEYEDYLGTGVPLKNVETAWNVGGSYVSRIRGGWYGGAQASFRNYQVIGQTPSDEENLSLLGITGLRSGGVGLVVQNDTRDSDNRPTRGWFVNANNFAFRESLGGDYDYDVYRLDLRGFWGQPAGHVFAARQNNQWTVDAPLEAKSSIALRGYKSGQYLGDNVSTIEVEERFRLARRWGAVIFAGVGCLYGGDRDCSTVDDLYPSAGAGMQFVLVPKDGIVGSLEYARGKGDNSGVYARVGYEF
jgi:hypothetical protein